jgi:hypothetical protein
MSKITFTIETEVNNNWIDYLVGSSDIFSTNRCGYWMYGMEWNEKLGYLCFEHEEKLSLNQVTQLSEYEAIVQAWREGKELPDHWFRLNKEVAIQAWLEGIKRWGMDWYRQVDAIKEDVVVQLALLGEVRYG